MLSFLNALCTALLARDLPEVRRLLARANAQHLPRQVREELDSWVATPALAPVRTLQHYHQTRQLLRADAAGDASATEQLELTLGPLDYSFGDSITLARAARLPGERRGPTPVTGMPALGAGPESARHPRSLHDRVR